MRSRTRRVADLAVRVGRLARLPKTRSARSTGARWCTTSASSTCRSDLRDSRPAGDRRAGHLAEHTVVGARWLATIPGLRRSCRSRWHHERFDGTGYPDRRGGHEVPLTIALVAVCDCWDAITEPRPYRTPCSFEDAMREMESGAGRQWSRVLVNWLLETVMADAEGQDVHEVAGVHVTVFVGDDHDAPARHHEVELVGRVLVRVHRAAGRHLELVDQLERAAVGEVVHLPRLHEVPPAPCRCARPPARRRRSNARP